MHEETLRIFLLSEGEAPFVIMNHITVEHFDTYMKRKGYSDGNRNIRLSHIKARVNEAIKYGLIKCEETSIRLHQATHVCTQGFRYKHYGFY